MNFYENKKLNPLNYYQLFALVCGLYSLFTLSAAFAETTSGVSREDVIYSRLNAFSSVASMQGGVIGHEPGAAAGFTAQGNLGGRNYGGGHGFALPAAAVIVEEQEGDLSPEDTPRKELQLDDIINVRREEAGDGAADCCTGANLALPGCLLQLNICEDYFPQTVDIDNDLQNTAEYFLRRSGETNDNVRELGACQFCLGQAYPSGDEDDEPAGAGATQNNSQFRTDYGAYLGAYRHALKAELVHEKFSALHQLNDSLYRFYGIHSPKLDQIYGSENRDEVLKQITCSDPDTLLNLIKNPREGTLCHSRKEALGDDYLSTLNTEENFLTKMGATGGDLESRVNNYFNNFNYGSESQCLARTRHGQSLAGHFYAQPDPSRDNVFPVENSLLVTGILDEVFNQERLSSGDVHAYCEGDSRNLPYSFIADTSTPGNFVEVVQRVMTSSSSSSLKRAMQIWGGASNLNDPETFLSNLGSAFTNLIDMEPTLGLLLADKSSFCEHYVPVRVRNFQNSTYSFLSNVYHRDRPAQVAQDIIEGAAANCESSYQEVADALCVDEAVLTDTDVGQRLVSPQLVSNARAHFNQVNFQDDYHGDEEEHEFEPLGHVFTPEQITIMEGAARCEDIYERAHGGVSAATHMFSTIFFLSQYNPSAMDTINVNGQEVGRTEFARYAIENQVPGAVTRNFQILSGSLVPSEEQREAGNNATCVLPVDLSGNIRRLYSNMGGYPRGSELDRLVPGLTSRNASIIGFNSFSEARPSGGVPPEDLLSQLEPSFMGSAEKTETTVRAADDQARNVSIQNGARSNNNGSSSAADSLADSSSESTSLLSGVGEQVQSSSVRMTGEQVAEAAKISTSGTELSRAPASVEMTEVSGDRGKSFGDLMDSTSGIREQFNNTQQYYNSAASRVVEDTNLSPNDVQRALSESDKDGNNFQQRFNSALDELDPDGSSRDEAAATLQNAIADPELEQRLLENEQISSDLREEIARLRSLVQQSKNRDTASEVATRSDAYITQLEQRIAELENQRPGAPSTSRTFSGGGRNLADTTTRGGNIGADERSLGPVRRGESSSSYFSPPPSSSSDGTEYIGVLNTIDRIVSEIDTYRDDFNLEYREKQLVLTVEREGISQPIDVTDVIVNRETGRVQSLVFPGNRVLETSELNEGSREALERFVAENESSILQAREAELVAIQEELAETIEVRDAARAVAGSPDDESLFSVLQDRTENLLGSE
ncbi:MAG: hypothetical protein CME65_07370 [Halobacteriovoraceae bacterium]|nr:hypothetical protein [Halobacteriovoraceae bacterium]|tara:strand:+ start:1663 stop:5346 length:3684 start_codon:yes stop_codon:yes gene_type:complete